MNFINKHILRFIAAMSLSVVAASCSQDHLGIAQDGTFLPGECPLKLTATVDEMATRAAETDFWVEDDEIRVRISDSPNGEYYPWIGKYALNTDGTIKKAIDALAWPYPDGYVSAWYPFLEDGTTVPIGDQSKGYHKFDFLHAHTEEKNYKDIVDLQFKHLMAKVRCELIKGDGVTEEDLKTAKIRYYGIPTVKFSEARIEGVGSPDYIISASDYSALLVPQDVSGQPFITVNLTLTVNGVPIPKTLIYTPQETMNLEAGKAYTFNIKVQKDRLEVQTISGAWTETLKETVPTSDRYRIYLPENTGELGELEFSNNVITEGTADTRAGSGRLVEVIDNSFTISFKTTLKNYDLGLIFVNKNTKNQVKRIYFEKKQNSVNVGYYEFTYTIASPIGEPVYLEVGEHIEVGDILFEDGSCGSIYVPNEDKKRPVGIVFRVGAGGGGEGQILDVPDTYNKCEGWDGHEIRGYAVALKDTLGSSWAKWYISNNGPRIFDTTDNIHKYYSGLYIADRLKEIVTTKKLKISDFQAFLKAEDYKQPVAPVGTSGWYLPSYHQLKDIRSLFEHPLRREWMQKAGGEFFTLRRAYCSATELNTGSIYIEAFAYDGYYNTLLKTINKAYGYAVRSVLTF